MFAPHILAPISTPRIDKPCGRAYSWLRSKRLHLHQRYPIAVHSLL